MGITIRRRRLLKGRRVPPGPCWVLICAIEPVQAVARVLSRMGPMAMIHMSYSLNSLKGGYIGDYIWEYFRVY